MGRYLVPVPFVPTVILGALPILYGGRKKQKQEFLPRIAVGDLILTMALTELEPSYDVTGVQLSATREGSHFILEGTKCFVPYAHVADYLVCAARTDKSVKEEEGVTLFLIKGDHPNIRYTVLETLDCEKQCEVELDRVEVSEEDIIGECNKGWEIVRKVLEQAEVAQCALMGAPRRYWK